MTHISEHSSFFSVTELNRCFYLAIFTQEAAELEMNSKVFFFSLATYFLSIFFFLFIEIATQYIIPLAL